MAKASETRTYRYINKQLNFKRWDTAKPSKGGSVYEQHEVNDDDGLKKALGGKIPDFVVAVDPYNYWVIEAKSDAKQIGDAIKQAMLNAESINSASGLICRIASGVAGSENSGFYVETRVLVGSRWEKHTINNRESTGLLSCEQIWSVLASGTADSADYQVDDAAFNKATGRINTLLNNASINKRNRAGVLACMLLALTYEPDMKLGEKLSAIIADLNTRAKLILEQYGKPGFYEQIRITPPPQFG